MKRNLLFAMMGLFILTSCAKTTESTVTENARVLIDKIADDNNFNVVDVEFSQMYIMGYGSNEADKIPKVSEVDDQVRLLNLLSGEFRLTLHGCNAETFNHIVENDKTYRALEVEGNSFGIVAYMKYKDLFKTDKKEVLFFVADSTLNVKSYSVKTEEFARILKLAEIDY
ncbi:MAG: hypothetical protein R3Y16_05170 [Rikenellaceae bacterium]